MWIEVVHRIVPAGTAQLNVFTLQELREFAKQLGLPTHKNKSVQVAELYSSGKAYLDASLAIKSEGHDG